jgi:hypothetical protein
MRRQIALVKQQGVGDGVIVSTSELEAILAVVEAADRLRNEFGLTPLMLDEKNPATEAAFGLDAALNHFELKRD